MKEIRFPVYFVTAYLIVYTMLQYAGVSVLILLPMFGFSPLLVIWMVYQVLKKGKPSNKTFDDQYYEDIS